MLQETPKSIGKANGVYVNGSPANGGDSKIEADRQKIWEQIREEHHDLLEQLPLVLHRHLSFIRDLDQQATANLDQIPHALKNYLELRIQLSPPKDIAEANTISLPLPSKRPISRQSFSSASLTPLPDSPSIHSASAPGSKLMTNDGSTNAPDEDEEDITLETIEQEENEDDTRTNTPPTSKQLINRVSLLAKAALRASLEKVNLAQASWNAVDRHIRLLDAAIQEQEDTISFGVRPGTHPATLLSSAIEAETPMTAAADASALAALAETALVAKDPVGQPTEKKKKVPWNKGLRRAAGRKGQQTVAQEEPRYCYCNGVSYGDMIACDDPQCEREWFHWGCVGITSAPTSKKWFCPDCAAKEPPKKKKKR